ncbi:hypothetical protein SSE37_22654 [Sagittula stellata E-37]|uniref:Virulence-associated protein E-like domain-containing protein n=1 Tax=Sagittula stellata (strain ATCC 700073 / DSM 11524 / E-37) TaxID=388399 RepID=A3JZX6_SAGS3|nr:hypothetical protein SSE37_22654 [Sagittula stellata E-37]
MGSTNDESYLRDPTGNRGYWPLKLNIEGAIDTDAFKVELPQIMGEAYACYVAMREAKPTGDLPLYLVDPEAQREATALQEGARVETPASILSEQLGAWLDAPVGEDFDDLDGTEPRYRDRICTQLIWTDFMSQDGRKTIPHQEVQSINNAMKMARGWEAKSSIRFENMGVRRGWVRSEAFAPMPSRSPKRRQLRDPEPEPLDLL